MADNNTMILSARGAIYQVSLVDASESSVAFSGVEHLTIDPDDRSPFSPILIDGISTSESDIVSRTSCLNNFKVYYSFGQNFGNIAIRGSVLLGPLGHVNTHGVERLMDFFATYRVSVYKKAIKASLLGKAYFLFLEGMEIGDVDTNYHVLPFLLRGTQIDLSRTAPPNINPNTIVLSDVNLDDSSLAAALSVTQTDIYGNTPSSAASNTQKFIGPPAPFIGPPAPFIGPPAPFIGPPAPFIGPPAPFIGPPAPFIGPPAPTNKIASLTTAPVNSTPSAIVGPPASAATYELTPDRIQSNLLDMWRHPLGPRQPLTSGAWLHNQ
jgi:hypothetical protein